MAMEPMASTMAMGMAMELTAPMEDTATTLEREGLRLPPRPRPMLSFLDMDVGMGMGTPLMGMAVGMDTTWASERLKLRLLLPLRLPQRPMLSFLDMDVGMGTLLMGMAEGMDTTWASERLKLRPMHLSFMVAMAVGMHLEDMAMGMGTGMAMAIMDKKAQLPLSQK